MITWSVDAMVQSIDLVFGIEPDGFIQGSALAYRIGAGFVPVRERGKLPNAVALGDLEVHEEAVVPGSTVLLVGICTSPMFSIIADALRIRGVNVLTHCA